MCVFSLFADRGPFSMSYCMSLSVPHNECVHIEMDRGKKNC